MIRIENLCYQTQNKTIIKEINTSFEAGKINLIIGPNGAGKSTLVKLLSGQLKPTKGSIVFSDHTNLSTLEWAQRRAVLSQHIEVNFPITAKEVVLMGRYPHFNNTPTANDLGIIKEVVHFFGIENLLDRNFMTLSGGEKQRVHFARVMAQIWQNHTDRILIMDEPLTFLDIHYQYDFMYKIKELSQQKNLTIIGVLHDLNLTAKFADTIYVINEGKVTHTGTKDQVLTQEIIKDTYSLSPTIFKTPNEYFISF